MDASDNCAEDEPQQGKQLGGDDFSLSNSRDQTPYPQHQAGGYYKIVQQHNDLAISGVPGVDLGATFNRKS